MKDELDEFLVRRFPQFFRERNSGPLVSSMYWGFQCGDGWFNIIHALCTSMEGHIKTIEQQNQFNQKYLDNISANKESEVPDWVLSQYKEGNLTIQPVPNVLVTEVKEKFGELRFSCQGSDKAIRGMINLASILSEVTCEECGQPGKKRSGGWIKVLCDKHAKEKKKSKKEEPLKVDDILYVLIPGKYIKLKISRIISQDEVIGIRVPDYDEPKDGEQEYFSASFINEQIHPYWRAEKFDG